MPRVFRTKAFGERFSSRSKINNPLIFVQHWLHFIAMLLGQWKDEIALSSLFAGELQYIYGRFSSILNKARCFAKATAAQSQGRQRDLIRRGVSYYPGNRLLCHWTLNDRGTCRLPSAWSTWVGVCASGLRTRVRRPVVYIASDIVCCHCLTNKRV